MNWFLYILKSKVNERYYIGITQNPERRLEYHNSIEKGFTSRYRPWELIFSKEIGTREDAQTIEKKIKSWKSRKAVENFIEKNK
ncbi:MAG: GIY-YIG nuclease family protein [Bacteroidetes bacterium]|nr:GIY-YIG nuclease family protein [Bacteroidota bacterium]